MAVLPTREQYEAFESHRNAAFIAAVYPLGTRSPPEVALAVGHAMYQVYMMDEMFYALFGIPPDEAASLVYEGL